MAALPTFISATEAAHELGISESRLNAMIESGVIKAAIIHGETVISETSIHKFNKQQPISRPTGIRKEDLPEYRKYRKYIGIPIWISNASRKYDIPNQTIVRWVAKGIIKRIGTDKNKVLIDQADIAYCAEIYRSHPGRGKWLFNTDGTPYKRQSKKVRIPI